MSRAGQVKSTTRTLLERKVPLNTILLPPISPELQEKGIEILRNVLVNKPKPGEILANTNANRSSEVSTSKATESNTDNDVGRVTPLEQNIRFLQEQHAQMLAGLHKEIDSLRHRNRDLQFQLVFLKGGIPSTPSSPEDDTKPKVYHSPKQPNTTPLQIEILEKEMGELKIQLQDVESRNAYLSAIVEEQKKKLERYERDRERELERANQHDPELLRKLDDAEAVIRRLRRENGELQREIANSSSATVANSYNGSHGMPPQRSTTSKSNGRQRGNSAGYYRGNWFPPLHAQTYWSNRRSGGGDRANTGEEPSLPSLPGMGASGNPGSSRRGGNNNHYHNGDGRGKYDRNGGGQSRRTKP